MTPEERARRQQLWQRHLKNGEDRETVIADLAAEFEVAEQTLEEDLDTIDEWLPRLDVLRNVGGISLLAELRANRQHLHQLADDARDADDLTEERKVREEINRSLNLERRMREGPVTTTKSDATLELEELQGDSYF